MGVPTSGPSRPNPEEIRKSPPGSPEVIMTPPEKEIILPELAPGFRVAVELDKLPATTSDMLSPPEPQSRAVQNLMEGAKLDATRFHTLQRFRLVGIGGELKYDNFVKFVNSTEPKHYADQSPEGKKKEWAARRKIIRDFMNVAMTTVKKDPKFEQLCRACHDNGYFAGERTKIKNPKVPFIGAEFKETGVVDGKEYTLKDVLTEDGMKAYEERFEKGGEGGYKITLDVVKPDMQAIFFKMQGKNPEAILGEIAGKDPKSVRVLNENAQSFADMGKAAEKRSNEPPSPREKSPRQLRLDKMKENQEDAVCSAVVIQKSGADIPSRAKREELRGEKNTDTVEVDRLTWIIWAAAIQYDGEAGWDNDAKVRKHSYEDLIQDPNYGVDEAKKDTAVWAAIYDTMGIE